MKLNILSTLCSILQIVGLVMIIFVKQLPAFTPILIGIAGFAAIVKFLIPDAKHPLDKILRPWAAVAGLGIIIIACVL